VNTNALNVTIRLDVTLPEGTNLQVNITYYEIASHVQQTVYVLVLIFHSEYLFFTILIPLLKLSKYFCIHSKIYLTQSKVVIYHMLFENIGYLWYTFETC